MYPRQVKNKLQFGLFSLTRVNLLREIFCVRERKTGREKVPLLFVLMLVGFRFRVPCEPQVIRYWCQSENKTPGPLSEYRLRATYEFSEVAGISLLCNLKKKQDAGYPQ